MNILLTYIIIAVLLLAAELVYFRIADRCNIIDKPNERSSHSTIVLRGGGIIFPIGVWIWYFWQMVHYARGQVSDHETRGQVKNSEVRSKG